MRPPHLVALFPSASYASRYDMVFQGGAFYLGDGLSWNLGQAKDARRRALEPTADRDQRDRPARRRSGSCSRADGYWQLPLDAMEALQLRRYSPGYFELLGAPAATTASGRRSTSRPSTRSSRSPAYHLTGWYDSLLNGTLANFSGLRANAPAPSTRAAISG